MNKANTILLVAMSNSIHTARWIEQLEGQGWNIHLFPSIVGTQSHPRLSGVTVHYLLHRRRITALGSPGNLRFARLRRGVGVIVRRLLTEFFPRWRGRQLARVIRRLRPDVVHSMEIQAAGYLTLSAKEILARDFPLWIVTNWGSDILLFGRLKEHNEKVRAVLAHCDFYSCECERDVALARKYGFVKSILPVTPNTGGYDLKKLDNIRHQTATSNRTIVMLKGYQGWAGRALVGLRALQRCADVLTKYSIVVYSAVPEVVIAAELFTDSTGISTKILPSDTPHDDILYFHAQARISIGLSIGDAISTSLLEAMVMGSFPIQSCTACADEWIEHGISGMIVPPEDPDVIELAIRSALGDDELVNRASRINWNVAQARLDYESLKQNAVQMYRGIMK